MAAAQTKGREEDKHTGMQGKKIRKRKENEKRKVGSKAQNQARKSYSRRLHSNKSSRLCYKAETGTVDKSPKVYTQLAREGVVLTQDSDNIRYSSCR